MTFPDIVGMVGVIIILVAYLLLQINTLRIEDILYSLINIIGSLMVLYSLFYNWNLSAVVIEVAWTAISLYGIFKTLRKRKST